jgi:bifunctional DNA-binding transcriptional regulator/antitoxin component of YhaV-PrlF toxin-antitoxin module
MKSKVSVRGQTVIPGEIRQALNITPDTILHWEVEDGAALVYPMPKDPVRVALGILKGKGTFEGFLRDRAEERAKELEQEGDAILCAGHFSNYVRAFPGGRGRPGSGNP